MGHTLLKDIKLNIHFTKEVTTASTICKLEEALVKSKHMGCDFVRIELGYSYGNYGRSPIRDIGVTIRRIAIAMQLTKIKKWNIVSKFWHKDEHNKTAHSDKIRNELKDLDVNCTQDYQRNIA